ncbi:hypothetical protein EGM51_00790 [Verrucomicrobia bacterium S94]|nr:hypothetical protein EGM51_00790 [Verrucomicrobia bacterium S94]
MLLFIFFSVAAVGCFIASVKEYQKLKLCLFEREEEPEEGEPTPSFSFVDLLFHDRIKEDADVRTIQKRTIGFFVVALLMVHVAMLCCGQCMQ